MSQQGNSDCVPILGPEALDRTDMRVVGKQVLDEFRRRHADAETDVEAWLAEAQEAEWRTPHDVRGRYPHARIIGRNIVFRIKGNQYRLHITISYKNRVIRIVRAGTHDEYNRWKY